MILSNLLLGIKSNFKKKKIIRSISTGEISHKVYHFAEYRYKKILQCSLFLKILFIYLFIYGCVGSSLPCEGLLQPWQVGATLHRGARALTIAASLVAEHRLQTRRLSNCGSRGQLFRGMRDPPRPGPEPVSPALAGRPPTTAPPGKPCNVVLKPHSK